MIHRSTRASKKLTDKQIEYVIRLCKKGESSRNITASMKVSQRHIQRLYAENRNAGTIYTHNQNQAVQSKTRLRYN